ncbi:sodium/hydrogen exchanger 8-like [Sinocyclocheilus grahami]|uniref:sodium/hydrogen exchanger 8-like n=1 Tax=Sinocyclocheilus grahami TaxID=75366 RepID=UPI0007AD02D0|nr:PREDICTED: sodium/hydrogen exchanger 8-like [Sinocyclocheilus grahami]
MCFSNRAAMVAVLSVILTADLGRCAAADDQTHSKNDAESDSNRAVSDLHDQSTADGHGEQLIRLNGTESSSNGTVQSTTPVPKPSTPEPPKNEPILPVQTGVKAQEEEQSSGMSIFFSLLVIGICIILVHLLIKFKLHFLPESVAVVSLGILMGAFIKIIESQQLANWKEEEMFRPNMFFLLLLPPIIFESGYSLHKGNFFQNIGSITLFAVFGTAISAFIVGGGIYFLGQADVIYKMTMTDSFAFGSLISAVDPVATIAIFNALNVDPVLNMLVFGESILNDAVSIVLTNTAEGFAGSDVSTGWETFMQALGYFLKMFFGSAALGTLTGLISAIVS